MFPDLPSDRGLSAAERLQLADLERRLGEDDPELVRTFDVGRPNTPKLPQAAAAVLVAVAIGLLLASVAVGGVGGGVAVLASLLLTPLALIGTRGLRRRMATRQPLPRIPRP